MKDTRLLPDDPKLTAYALGELTGDERAAVEAALRRNPALRAQVEEIRAMAQQLEAALGGEPFVSPAPVRPFILHDSNEPIARTSESRTAKPARRTRRRLVARTEQEAGPGARPRDAYERERATLLTFPRLYYVIGGLAAACFAVIFAVRPPKPGPAALPQATETHAAARQISPPANAVPVTPAAPSETPSVAQATPPPATEARAESAPSPAPESTPVIAAATPVAPAATPAFLEQGLSLIEQVQPELEKLAANAARQGAEFYSAARNTLRGEATSPAPASGTSGEESGKTDESMGQVASLAGPRTEEAAPAFEKISFTATPPPVPGSLLAASNIRAFMPGSTSLVPSSPAANPAGADIVMLLPFMVSADRATGFAVAPGLEKMATRKRVVAIERENLPRPPPGAKFGRRVDPFAPVRDNDFARVADTASSTFSIDVDTASYANIRRLLTSGAVPPREAVRIEEMLNYFPYHYAAPVENVVAASLEVADAPWAPGHRLVRVGLKARDLAPAQRPAANLVFLIDVSSSMGQRNKLPLVKEAMRTLIRTLRPDDHVAIVTYAGNSGLALPSTPASHAREILNALDALTPATTTGELAGIELAYDVARANFLSAGINRVILCTDGDFDVGLSGESLLQFVADGANAGVALTALGFGVGAYPDAMLEKLASRGNGSYGYVDTRREAEKLLSEQVNSTLVTLARDVKIRVDFNPAQVASYRLIGYENRLLRKEDFNDDTVDAGDLGTGQTVTALYEIVPVRSDGPRSAAGPVSAKAAGQATGTATVGELAALAREELLTVRVRYKNPHGFFSWMPKTLEFPLVDTGASFAAASADFRFAAAVAQFGMFLRDSPHRGEATLGDVVAWAAAAAAKAGDDPGGYRGEFIDLVRKAQVMVE